MFIALRIFFSLQYGAFNQSSCKKIWNHLVYIDTFEHLTQKPFFLTYLNITDIQISCFCRRLGTNATIPVLHRVFLNNPFKKDENIPIRGIAITQNQMNSLSQNKKGVSVTFIDTRNRKISIKKTKQKCYSDRAPTNNCTQTYHKPENLHTSDLGKNKLTKSNAAELNRYPIERLTRQTFVILLPLDRPHRREPLTNTNSNTPT